MAPTAHSPSPGSPHNGSPALPLSKRDKRRTLIQEKLQEMLSTFSSNMRPQYDAQVSAIYADIGMIQRADPYKDQPLDTSGDAIQAMVDDLQIRPVPAEGSEDDGNVEGFDNTVGRFYRQFADQVNDALEARDLAITQASSRFEYTMHSLQQTRDHRIMVAQEEHRLLAESIRSRLVQSLSQKRARLLREKEQLDIGDSNAMLLHPSQFSITNPASPGGANHPRKTRHARHRIGDPEEAVNSEGKRKRKGVFDEDRDAGGSPGPNSKNIEFGNGSPFRDARQKAIHHQYEAPAYSIDRLFSDKELALNMNNAQIAVRHFLIKLRNQGQENGTTQPTTNGNGHIPMETDNPNEPTLNQDRDIPMASARNSPAPGDASADDNDFQHPSTRAHLRGHTHGPTSRTLPIVGLPPLSYPVNFTNSNKIPTAPPPPSLTNAEVDEDLAIITGMKPVSPEVKEQILDNAVNFGRTWEPQFWGPGDRDAAEHIRETNRRLVLGMDGTQDALPGRDLSIPPHLLQAMEGRSTPTSNPFAPLGTGADALAAGGGFGGVPMSRNGSASAAQFAASVNGSAAGVGGAPMRRTGSGRPGEGTPGVNGHEAGSGFLGRGRGRGRGRGGARAGTPAGAPAAE